MRWCGRPGVNSGPRGRSIRSPSLIPSAISIAPIRSAGRRRLWRPAPRRRPSAPAPPRRRALMADTVTAIVDWLVFVWTFAVVREVVAILVITVVLLLSVAYFT